MPDQIKSWLTPVNWFQSDGVWMARQSLADDRGTVGAIVGKVWTAQDASKGQFYYAAGAWCMGREVNGYAASLANAKRAVEDEAYSCTRYQVKFPQVYFGA